MEQARRTLTGFNRWDPGDCGWGRTRFFSAVFLAPVLLKFHKEYPNILLEVESFDSDESFRLLENNQVDVLLTLVSREVRSACGYREPESLRRANW